MLQYLILGLAVLNLASRKHQGDLEHEINETKRTSFLKDKEYEGARDWFLISVIQLFVIWVSHTEFNLLLLLLQSANLTLMIKALFADRAFYKRSKEKID